MNPELIRKMQKISPEEQSYLDGNATVNKELYTSEIKFEIDRNRFLKEGRLITVRPHSRFIDFPAHRHNYIEIMYVCQGTITHYLVFRLGENQAIENLMENMISSMLNDEQNEDSINQYSMGIVFLYLLRHVDCLTQSSSQSYKDVVVQSTLSYIDTWYKTATLSKIAEDFHQSLSVLSKMIKQTTGFTFQELLQRKRFQKAVMLLVEFDLPIEEIAVAVGYENQSYFCRKFKERYGMTPRKYRLEHKNDRTIRI